MANESLTDLLSVLNDCRLLESEQIHALASALEAPNPQPQALRMELHQRGWLTAFQIDKVMRGEAAQLSLGQYVLLDLLGEGGMGLVYKARHRLMNRVVALKVIRQDQLSSEAAVKRFHREIQASAQLSHPNVVIAHDADKVGSTHFFVMEFVEGADLGKLVQKVGPLPIGEACDCIRQAALGLQHAHEKGLVHRDIKPSNLLLTQHQGIVKVLDMGLARLRQENAEASEHLTRPGMVMGTPDYMAPEQGANSHQVDIRADIYSLGCTLFFLLTGRVTFPDCTMVEKLIKHRTDDPVPVQALRAEVPAEVDALLRRMMSKRPDDRFQTPGQVAAALAPLCQPVRPAEQFVPAAAPEPMQPAPSGYATPPVNDLELRSPQQGAIPTRGERPVPPPPSFPPPVAPPLNPSWTPVGFLPRADAAAYSGVMEPARKSKRSLAALAVSLVLALVVGLGAAWIYNRGGGGVTTQGQVAVHPGSVPETGPLVGPPTSRPEDKPKPPPVRQGEQKLALVIGAGRFGGNDLRPLPAAETDAESLAGVLEKQGFPRDNIRLLTPGQPADRQPLAANIHKNLREMVQDRDSTDSLVVAWSGHAVQFPGESDTYLCPGDARLTDRTTLVPLADVYRALGECKAGYKLVLLDVCRANPQAEGAKPRVELDVVARPQKQTPPPGVAVLFGCSAGEQGFDRMDQPGGAFFDAVNRSLTQKVDVEQFVREQVGPYVQKNYKQAQSPLRLGATAGTSPLASLKPFQQAVQTIDLPPMPPTEKVGPIGRMEGHVQPIQSLAFLPNRPEALSCSMDYTMRLWNLDTQQEVAGVKYDPNIEDLIWSVAISSDGNRAVTGCGGKLEDNGKVRLSSDNVLLVWDIKTGRVQRILKGHDDAVVSVALSQGGRFAVSGSMDKSVRGWDLETGRELFRCAGHKQPVMAVALNRDGDVIASSSRDRTVRLWDARTGKHLRTLEGHKDAVGGVAFSPDGRRLVSCSFDKTCKLWEVSTGEEIGAFDGHTDGVWCVAYAPDGERVLSGGADNLVRLWEVRGFRQIEVFKGHRATVNCVAFSPDGTKALSGGDDLVMRYWALPKPVKP